MAGGWPTDAASSIVPASTLDECAALLSRSGPLEDLSGRVTQAERTGAAGKLTYGARIERAGVVAVQPIRIPQIAPRKPPPVQAARRFMSGSAALRTASQSVP